MRPAFQMKMRFFFHLHNDVLSFDEEGRELPDTDTARAVAEEEARTMAAESVRKGHLNLAHYVEVVDEAGDILFTVPFGEVVDIRCKKRSPRQQP